MSTFPQSLIEIAVLFFFLISVAAIKKKRVSKVESETLSKNFGAELKTTKTETRARIDNRDEKSPMQIL